MNAHEFNALLKGQLIDNPLYKKYYQDNSVKISNEVLEDISVDFIESCSYNIYLENIIFSGNFHFNGGTFETVEFSNVKFENSEGIFFSKLNIKLLRINRKSKLGLLRFSGKCKVQTTVLLHSEIDRVFITEECNFDNFNILQTSIKAGFMIWNGMFDNFTVSNNSAELHKIAYISTLDFTIKCLKLSDNAAIDKIYFRRGSCDKLIVDSPEVKEILVTRLVGSKFEPPLSIKEIEFKGIGKMIVTLPDIAIEHIKFVRYFASKECSFNFINLTLNKLEFDNYINTGEFILGNLNMPNDSEFIINHSDLGKMSLFNSNISSAKLSFNSSKITGIFISKTEISKTIIASNDELRSFYSQIKKVYEGKGDSVTSNFFYSKEMNAYSASLTWNQDFGEKINILLNKISTNHGQSWLQGFFSSLIICLFTYSVYVFLLGFRLSNDYGSSSLFIRLWAYFFEFINPVHKSDAIAIAIGVKNPTSYAVLWEGFSRIPIAYFIYQLIQAFRKHGKK